MPRRVTCEHSSDAMRAMVLFEMNHVLKEAQLPDPEPAPGEILVRVEACAVCRTDLHVIDGDLPNPKLPGGIVVCGGIHMSDIPQFPYRLLWGEREICSVANLTRKDAEDFMTIAPKVPVRTHFETFPLTDANEALRRLRHGQLQGAAVLLTTIP